MTKRCDGWRRRHCTRGTRPRAVVTFRGGDAAVSVARMVELGRVIDQLAFPPNVGAGLAARGFAPGASKSILSPASRALAVKIEAELRALFLQWGLALGPVSAAV